MASNYRTDRALPFPATTAAEGLDAGTLMPGDRVKVVKQLIDTKAVKAGATGTVIWTDSQYRPVLQLEDGTVVNLIQNDTLAPAAGKGARGSVSLLTLRHNTETWKPGYESDVYLRIPSSGTLEKDVRSLVDAHNQGLRGQGYGRDINLSVESGAWDGPDLKPAAAKKIVIEALADWAA